MGGRRGSLGRSEGRRWVGIFGRCLFDVEVLYVDVFIRGGFFLVLEKEFFFGRRFCKIYKDGEYRFETKVLGLVRIDRVFSSGLG